MIQAYFLEHDVFRNACPAVSQAWFSASDFHDPHLTQKMTRDGIHVIDKLAK